MTRAGCDGCNWEGESSQAAKRHNAKTGHTTWAETVTITFYGDPLEQFCEAEGLTREDSA